MDDVITVVSGLPRSGTSMMMKMLEAGGLPVVTDELRTADEDNPKGYYELEIVKQIDRDTSWVSGVQGKAIKMVSKLLYHLPSQFEYRIIFMHRDLDEMLASQEVMLARKGEKPLFDMAQTKSNYVKHLREIEQWLAGQGNMRVLHLQYRDVLTETEHCVDAIRGFLGDGLRRADMMRIVDPALYRQRACGKHESLAGSDKTAEPANEQENAQIEARLKSLGYM